MAAGRIEAPSGIGRTALGMCPANEATQNRMSIVIAAALCVIYNKVQFESTLTKYGSVSAVLHALTCVAASALIAAGVDH